MQNRELATPATEISCGICYTVLACIELDTVLQEENTEVSNEGTEIGSPESKMHFWGHLYMIQFMASCFIFI